MHRHPKFYYLILIFLSLSTSLFAKPMNINFKNLKIKELVHITSRVFQRNILMVDDIKGKVDFISNNPIEKEELLDILHLALKSKGYTLKQENSIYVIVKESEDNDIAWIELQNVEAKQMMAMVNSFINKQDSIITLSILESSNTLLLKGTSTNVKNIKRLIKTLDKDTLQVYVKARIIEVNDNLVSDIGVKYGIFGSEGNSGGLFSFSSHLNGGKAIPTIPSGINLELPKLYSGIALGASINLLEKNRALDIVSEPSILCINNKESSIYVGETISIKTGETTNDTGSINSYSREDVGLKLKVKPRISRGNKVALEINAVLEGVTTTDPSSQNPNTSKKEVKTTAIVHNGESVILGGLIETKKEKTEEKIPLLSSIPIFGEVFKNKNQDKKQNNLVIIITPYIIPKSKDLTYVRNQLTQLKLLEERYLKKSLEELKTKENKLKRKSYSTHEKHYKLLQNSEDLN